MSRKHRLDLHLLKKGFATSRQKAQQLIRAGKVRDLNGKLLDKPGQEVSKELELRIKKSPRFVSRGGEKLIAGLEQFSLPVNEKVCLDAGISTGGFTDCLLQHGASKVYGIDVGYGQTAWNLRNDPRLVLFERTNIRNLTPEKLYGPTDPWPTFAVADLSFISLKLVLPAIRTLLDPNNAEALLLVKPQFEVGRERVGKGGVVREKAGHIDALKSVIKAAGVMKWAPKGLIPSPITGPAGNHEYLLWLGTNKISASLNLEQIVKNTLT